MLFLGIDGGGTKCRARIRDEAGRLLGEGLGGPANIHQDFAGTVRSILEASGAACAAANLPQQALAQLNAGLGLAGVETFLSHKPLREALPFAAFVAINDAPAACLGAHRAADGGIVIAGTGSAGCAIVDGKTTVIGGWGFELGDDGSGAIMGRAAVRAAVASIDGLGPATGLTEDILERLGRTRTVLTAWVKSATTAGYGQFAPGIFAHADRGDVVAGPILAKAVEDLGGIARALLDLGAGRLSLLGGLAGPLAGRLPAHLQRRFVAPQADATDGAIMAARREAGLPMAWSTHG
jgi:glucosamine kinase